MLGGGRCPVSRFLIIAGKVWLFLAAFLILLGYASSLYNDGVVRAKF
jgi:hypothetical protein